MTILQALDGYYGRMAARGEAEAPGYSREKIHFAIVLAPDGAVDSVMDLRQPSGRKLVPALRAVPAALKRTVGIAPNLLWDKSAYVLGRTGGTGKRTAEEHAAFRKQHLDLLADTSDAGDLRCRTARPDRARGPAEAGETIRAGRTPLPVVMPACRRCSLHDQCLPERLQRAPSVARWIGVQLEA